ncbi:MAG: 50S ribosomal protein L13, partial [Deltaproteobacteria bacterium]|nr:50S ribosomal protein L13 [Deltaproteobacteria bacterium]
VAVNAGKVLLTGSKPDKKIYRKHTGYLGHLREKKAKDMLQDDPVFPIREAVKGMLPRGVLGRKMLRKLKVYAGAEHPHEAQQPEKITL